MCEGVLEELLGFSYSLDSKRARQPGNVYLYFTFSHSTQEVMIVLETAWSPALPLLTLASSLGLVDGKRRKTARAEESSD